MKTKQEFLKIYSAYFPYELQIGVMGEFSDEERKVPQIFEMVGLDADYVEYHEVGRTVTEQIEFTDVFPCLRPMEMLAQEIEHNGERFVPLEIIGQMIDKNYEVLSEDGNGAIIGKDVNPSCACPYECDCEVTSYNLFYNNLNFYSTVYVDGDQDNFIEEVVHESYLLVQKLLEWHFNVFGLEESEYIKKETLNRSENPNS